MDKQYYIDKIVLGYLMGHTDDNEIESNHDNYISVLNELMKNIIKTFLKEKGQTDEQINQLFTALESEAQNDDAEPSIAILKDPQLEKLIENATNVFNKSIYDKFLPGLSEDTKLALEDYLQTAQTGYRTAIDYMLTVLGTMPEEQKAQPPVPTQTPAVQPTPAPQPSVAEPATTPTPTPSLPAVPPAPPTQTPVNFTKTE